MTKPAQDQVLPFKELMASVGYFFLHWGQLETTLDSQILGMRGIAGAGSTERPAGDMTKRLSEWRQLVRQTEADPNLHSASDEIGLEIERLRVHRNLIAHGLRAGLAGSLGGQAHIRCIESGNGSQVGSIKTYTKPELDQLVQAVDRCYRAVRSLRNWFAGS